jgi:hypothetical protein
MRLRVSHIERLQTFVAPSKPEVDAPATAGE